MLYKENRREMHVRRVGSCGVRREFRSEACALGCDGSRARFPLPHWNVAPFASSSLYWASTLRYLSPCRRQVASREKDTAYRGIRWKQQEHGQQGTDNSKLLFLQTEWFYFANAGKQRPVERLYRLDRKLVDEIQGSCKYSQVYVQMTTICILSRNLEIT